MKRFGRVAVPNPDRLLHDDFAAVGYLVDEMNRCARYLDALFKRRLVDAKPVEALAAERRDERRVNVDYPALISAREVRAQYAHIAREDYQVYIVLFKYFGYFFFDGRLTAELLLADRNALYPGFRRALERVSAGVARDDQFYLAVLDYPAFLRVDKSLKIRAAAGDKNRYFSLV